jgi:hypothetical protein
MRATPSAESSLGKRERDVLSFVYANRGYVMDFYMIRNLGASSVKAAENLCRLGFLVEESGVYALPAEDDE